MPSLQFKSYYEMPSNPWTATDHCLAYMLIESNANYGLYNGNTTVSGIHDTGTTIAFLTAKPGDVIKVQNRQSGELKSDWHKYVCICVI